jgi:hypothetical protein
MTIAGPPLALSAIAKVDGTVTPLPRNTCTEVNAQTLHNTGEDEKQREKGDVELANEVELQSHDREVNWNEERERETLNGRLSPGGIERNRGGAYLARGERAGEDAGDEGAENR